jgi:hypothetical protein
MNPTPEYTKQLRTQRKKEKRCITCGAHPAIKNRTKCIDCKARSHQSYLRHRDRILKTQGQIWRHNKVTVIDHYGAQCACCQEDFLPFLTIDHINGGGTQHRIELKQYGRGACFYQWLIQNKYPSGFQVLCANCNTAKGNKEKCPCQDKRD